MRTITVRNKCRHLYRYSILYYNKQLSGFFFFLKDIVELKLYGFIYSENFGDKVCCDNTIWFVLCEAPDTIVV